MRIALLSLYNGNVFRGVESWSLQMCHQLALLGHQCLLVQGGSYLPQDPLFETRSVGCDFPDRSDIATRSDRALRRFELHRRGREAAVFAGRCLKHLVRFEPDIVVPVNNFPVVVAMVQLYRLTRSAKTRIVVRTPNGYDMDLRRSLLLGAHGVTASEPGLFLQIVAVAKRPSALIPVGIDVERFHKAAPAPLALERPVVLTTSALLAYKRVELAVRAAARGGLSIVVLGDGPRRAEICALGERLLGPRRFLWRASVPFSEVPAYYQAADVFTLPSEAREPFAVVALEGMAAGLPVVLNDDPVRRWMASPGGHFVDPSNIDAYARALCSAASEGRRNYPDLQRFHWSTVARQWDEFFHKLVSQASTSSVSPRLP